MSDTRLDKDQWGDWKWRLSNIYSIIDARGKKVRFCPNAEQLDFIENIWYLNLILKARRLGFTTLVGLIGLDLAVFNSNQRCGIIAQTESDAKMLFRDKIKYPYDNLPEQIKSRVYPVTDSTSELLLSNNSGVAVGISLRGQSLNFVHISEFGYICSKFPERANEIVTGTLNTLVPGQFATIESTAKGRGGYFYKYVSDALKAQQKKEVLTKLDFELHFYPWYSKKEHYLDPEGVEIPKEMREYFDRLDKDHGINLSDGQKAWYVKKKKQMELDPENQEDIRAEFPSYPEEAFDVAIRGAIYADQMKAMRASGRIRKVPLVPTYPVNTFWDLGRNTTSIWFHQYIANEHRFIRYYENKGKDLAHFFGYMQNLANTEKYIFGRHFLPHDAENKNLEHSQSRVDRLIELGVSPQNIVVVDRIENVEFGIEQTKKFFGLAWIDAENCAEGITMLDNYQYEYNERLATFTKNPLGNYASHGADAFRQWAQGWHPRVKKPDGKKKKRNWRTA